MPTHANNMTQLLADFVTNASPEDSFKDIVRYAIVDCFGVILSGAKSDVAERVAKGLSVNGQGSAPIYGTNRTSSPANAALVNAVAGHAFDLDDWEVPANTHPTVVLLPACLATAHGQRISGESLLAAYAVGFEVIVRLGESLTLDHYNRGFHSTATIGSIGAAGAVSRLLNLDVDSTVRALSIAATQASGYTLNIGTHTKPLQAGLAARIGVESAYLAKSGITVRTDVVEHTRGFAGLMGIAGQSLKALGDPWALSEHGISLKRWPSCGYAHRLMTAALELRPQVINRLNSIRGIEATLPDFHKQILPFDDPGNYAEALFSVSACIAQILASGDLTLADSASRFWEQPQVRRLIKQVSVTAKPANNPMLNLDPQQPDRLRILFDDEVLDRTCAYPLGAPQFPLSKNQIAQKFVAISGLELNKFEQLSRWPESHNMGDFWVS